MKGATHATLDSSGTVAEGFLYNPNPHGRSMVQEAGFIADSGGLSDKAWEYCCTTTCGAGSPNASMSTLVSENMARLEKDTRQVSSRASTDFFPPEIAPPPIAMATMCMSQNQFLRVRRRDW